MIRPQLGLLQPARASHERYSLSTTVARAASVVCAGCHRYFKYVGLLSVQDCVGTYKPCARALQALWALWLANPALGPYSLYSTNRVLGLYRPYGLRSYEPSAWALQLVFHKLCARALQALWLEIPQTRCLGLTARIPQTMCSESDDPSMLFVL